VVGIVVNQIAAEGWARAFGLSLESNGRTSGAGSRHLQTERKAETPLELSPPPSGRTLQSWCSGVRIGAG